ncbi:MAG: HEAT repeat domain-containing protein [Deltaproteobacteria bacterium]|nr:HEAT repeat domain-containing protein [Deltaproteobacteria bacterium]
MATIIAFPEHAVQESWWFEEDAAAVAAARGAALEQLWAEAFDVDVDAARRREVAASSAALFGSPELCDRVLPLLDELTGVDLQVAALLLGFPGNRRAIFPLANLLSDPEPEVRRAAMDGLAAIRDPRAIGFLVGALRRDPEQAPAALAALCRFGFEQTAHILQVYLRSDDPEVSLVALGAHRFAPAAAAGAAAGRFLEHRDPRHRALAVMLLERAGRRCHLEPLLPLLGDPDPRVRLLCADAISAIRARP